MLLYEHIIWFNEPRPCELCGAQTFMAALREMKDVLLARDAHPQSLCQAHILSRLSGQDRERVEQDLKWLSCTALHLQTTRALDKDSWDTALRVLRMNYTLLWLWHKGEKAEARRYRDALEHDPSFDQRTKVVITDNRESRALVPHGTAITMSAPASIVHSKVLTALLEALKPGNDLCEDISVTIASTMQRVLLPADSSLHNDFI